MTDPAGLTREKWNLYEKATGAKLQRSDDLLSTAILDMLRQAYGIGDGLFTNGVVSGFVCSAEAGTLNVRVTRGLALAATTTAFDPSDFTESNLAALVGRMSTGGYFGSVPLDPGDGDDRIDSVYVFPSEADADTQTVQIYQGGVGPFVSENKETQRRNVPVITVSKGTPAPVPVPTPLVGGVLLYAVRVPAGVVNLDTATFTDYRYMLGRVAKVGRVEPWAAATFDVDGDVENYVGAGTSKTAFNATVAKIGVGVYVITMPVAMPADLWGHNVQATGFKIAGFVVTPIVVTAVITSTTTIGVAVFDMAGNPVSPSSVSVRADVVRL